MLIHGIHGSLSFESISFTAISIDFAHSHGPSSDLITSAQCLCFGMSGAFLGILTPGGGIYSVATNLTQHFQHSFIILNLAWCIGALNMRATKRSILFALFVLNLLVIPIGTYNYFTGENFFFLREAPVTLVYNPLLPVTTWPWYILWIEMIFIPYCYLFYLPIRED